jgi:chemotaxis protein methyltransferase CheR
MARNLAQRPAEVPVGAGEGAALPPRVFEKVRKLVYDAAGIELREGKEALVTARLGKRMRETGCASYEAYVDQATGDATGQGLLDLIDALTTNYTSFLREPAHFEFLRKEGLAALGSQAASGLVEVWCAAAATGEEPYSIVFTLLEMLGLEAARAGSRCRVLATDISTRALEQARRGVYQEERFSSLPREWLRRYLLKGSGASAGFYRVRPEVARLVEFRRVNLIEPLPHDLARGPGFPLIWCRNVMIYFDAAVQQRVITALERSLAARGYLFIGHSESLSGVNHSLEYVAPATYRRRG